MVQVRSRLTAGLSMVAIAALGVVGGVSAQDASPVAGGAMAGIPNHIHAGTCDALGSVVQPLADLQYASVDAAAMASPVASPMASPMASPVAGMATPMAGMMGMMGAASSVPVAVASTQVPLGLSDILAAEHAINAHDPADPSNPDRYLACGAIGGSPDAQGNLFVGLRETNDSGFSGVAWLLDDGSGAGTRVTVFLANTGATTADMGVGMMDTASPAASPTS
jgi:hypothetical protein